MSSLLHKEGWRCLHKEAFWGKQQYGISHSLSCCLPLYPGANLISISSLSHKACEASVIHVGSSTVQAADRRVWHVKSQHVSISDGDIMAADSTEGPFQQPFQPVQWREYMWCISALKELCEVQIIYSHVSFHRGLRYTATNPFPIRFCSSLGFEHVCLKGLIHSLLDWQKTNQQFWLKVGVSRKIA